MPEWPGSFGHDCKKTKESLLDSGAGATHHLPRTSKTTRRHHKQDVHFTKKYDKLKLLGRYYKRSIIHLTISSTARKPRGGHPKMGKMKGSAAVKTGGPGAKTTRERFRDASGSREAKDTLDYVAN